MTLGWNIEQTVKTCGFEKCVHRRSEKPILAGGWENPANKCTSRSETLLRIGEALARRRGAKHIPKNARRLDFGTRDRTTRYKMQCFTR